VKKFKVTAEKRFQKIIKSLKWSKMTKDKKRRSATIMLIDNKVPQK